MMVYVEPKTHAAGPVSPLATSTALLSTFAVASAAPSEEGLPFELDPQPTTIARPSMNSVCLGIRRLDRSIVGSIDGMLAAPTTRRGPLLIAEEDWVGYGR